MMLIQKLKEETAVLHEQVEQENLARFIMDHSIDLETYKLLLYQNYVAYLKTEKAINVHLSLPEIPKYRRLKADLAALGVTVEKVPDEPGFECKTLAEALGAAYVVEGSALGGMVLARNISKCPELDAVEKHHFFNDDRQNISNWQNFKSLLKRHDLSSQQEEESLQKAQETFRFFREVFRKRFELSTAHS